MQLSSTKFLYLSAHPLHKVRLQSRTLEKVMHSVLALLGRGKVSLGEAWQMLSPKSSLITSGVRTYIGATAEHLGIGERRAKRGGSFGALWFL
jgi:hypothetical protein